MMRNAVQCKAVAKDFHSKDLGWMGHWLRRLRGEEPLVATVVRGVDFEVAEGEIFGILGPNGSGKSTLIRMISTLLLPDRGRIEIFGLDVTTRLHEVRRLLNRVSVDAALHKKLSPVENLLVTARVYGLTRRSMLDEVHAILERVGFTPAQMAGPVEEFSRGMQQKVSIARAFLTRPRLLLLDEPTTGLDPKSKRDVQAMIEAYRDETRAAIILTTHDMEEADRLCDRVAIIRSGRFLATDTAEGLKALLPPGTEPRNLESVFLHLTGDTWNADALGDSPPGRMAA